MEKRYYREYYNLERKHWWFTARAEILMGLVNKLQLSGELPQHNLKILNVGCGPGRSSERLANFGQVISVEYDKDCCAFASELTGLEIQYGSITELDFADNTFDLVCAFDVIEHVQDDATAVSELKRVAKIDGNVLVTVPAFMSLWSHHDVVNQHFKRYRLNEIERLFKISNNGRLLYSSYFNFFLFPPIFAFRVFSNLFKFWKNRSGSGSDFEAFSGGVLNTILFWCMRPEGWFINAGIKLPFGVSILCSWKKTC